MVADESADRAATLTLSAFNWFNAIFQVLTRRAQRRFRERDWAGGRRDATERFDLYERALDLAETWLDATLGPRTLSPALWVAAKTRFAGLVAHRYDVERAETFYNSVTRRMLSTVGIDREVEFFHLHPKPVTPHDSADVVRTYASSGDTASLVRTLLGDVELGVPYEDIDRDARLIAQEIDLCLWPLIGTEGSCTIEVVTAVFYRRKEAYIVGRILVDERPIPLLIPLVHGDGGVYADTVLLHEADASIVFSFAYSYFFVDVERYDALIHFLHTIIPRADMAELFTALGYNRHGKTEFYRDLHRFVHVSKEQFDIAPGLEGAVMIAFTLPNYDSVLKVIKDRPCFLRSSNQTTKTITKEQVRKQYDFVAHRDRAGRMVDTQEFENLRFRRKRFSKALLREFVLAAREGVEITDNYVVIRHVYVQRRVIPLPFYFQREKDPEAIRRVLIDFGWFLKDIASSGVFPADLFNTWNYGVTHWGRVVLYDYDDVLPMERISIREKPVPRDEVELDRPEEDWIVVGEDDFFLDEMERYSGIPKPLKGVFRSTHGDLFTLRFWTGLKDRLRSGEIFSVIPYDRAKRFLRD